MELNVLLAGVFLIICSVTDIRKRQVSVIVCLLSAVAGVILHVIRMNDFHEIWNLWQTLLPSLIPGIGLILLANITKEKIGKGDGLVMIIMGILLGMETSVQILIMAFILSAFVAAILLVSKRVKKDQEIPFVPFLAAGMCLMILGRL